MLDATLFNKETPLTQYQSDVWRVVESQERAATLQIVDDLAEQELLEQLLDVSKPVYRAGTEHMHYLLKTAFRYPPLPWGSRFGTRLMPSYFYASEAVSTALCECAYYRFMFFQDMQEPYDAAIRSEFNVFTVEVDAAHCLNLVAPTFAEVNAQISNPCSYQSAQVVGAWAFEQGNVDVIRFRSARDLNGVNVALANPAAIRSQKPKTHQRWLCLSKPQSVSFNSRDSAVSYVFKLANFCDAQGLFLRAN